MPAQARCPHCQLSLRVPNDHHGKSVKCPQCQKRFIVELPMYPPVRQPQEEAQPSAGPKPAPVMSPEFLLPPTKPSSAPAPVSSASSPAKSEPARPPKDSVTRFEDLVLSVLEEEDDTPEPTERVLTIGKGTPGKLQKLQGPSNYWRCTKCDAIWEKKPLLAAHLENTRIKAMVRCETCGKSFDYQDVHGGKMDAPEVKVTCTNCGVELRGPEQDLLGQKCPGCSAFLPRG